MDKKCKQCQKPISNKLKFCSKKCRIKYNNQKYKQYQKQWGKNKRGTYSSEKIQCNICGKYYKFLDPHLRQTHAISVNKYKEIYGLDRKKGLITNNIKLLKKDYVFTNGTIENLKKGINTRYKKGDKNIGIYIRRKETLIRLKENIMQQKLKTGKICEKDNNNQEYIKVDKVGLNVKNVI